MGVLLMVLIFVMNLVVITKLIVVFDIIRCGQGELRRYASQIEMTPYLHAFWTHY